MSKNIGVTKNYVELKKAFNDPKKRIAVFQGSSRSSKTFSIMMFLIEYCISNPNKVVMCFRHDRATCRDSVTADFKKLMGPEFFGLWNDNCFNKSEQQYSFENGSIISFKGTSNPEKLRGPTQNIAFFNECTEISKEAYSQVAARTTDFLICDFNPSTLEGWYYDLQGLDDVAYIKSTFRDNPYCPDNSRREILSWEPTPENKRNLTADPYKWKVFGLGEPGVREGVIYPSWAPITKFPAPEDCQRHGYGLDLGYSQDPTALVECALHGDRLYFKELLYETGLVTTDIIGSSAQSLERRLNSLNLDPNARIWVDDSRPESIAALKAAKFNVHAARKGKNSIIAGIDLIKSFPICIDVNSSNLKSELYQYCWKLKGEAMIDTPIDDYNHALDSMRYWAYSEIRNPSTLYRNMLGNHGKPRVKVARGIHLE